MGTCRLSSPLWPSFARALTDRRLCEYLRTWLQWSICQSSPALFGNRLRQNGSPHRKRFHRPSRRGKRPWRSLLKRDNSVSFPHSRWSQRRRHGSCDQVSCCSLAWKRSLSSGLGARQSFRGRSLCSIDSNRNQLLSEACIRRQRSGNSLLDHILLRSKLCLAWFWLHQPWRSKSHIANIDRQTYLRCICPSTCHYHWGEHIHSSIQRYLD